VSRLNSADLLKGSYQLRSHLTSDQGSEKKNTMLMKRERKEDFAIVGKGGAIKLLGEIWLKNSAVEGDTSRGGNLRHLGLSRGKRGLKEFKKGGRGLGDGEEELGV